jgi:hypothetical protein
MPSTHKTHETRSNASKLHKEVFAVLTEALPNYTIHQEYCIRAVLPDNAGEVPLFFDMYIPDMSIAIECQGVQHFKPNSLFFNGRKSFRHMQGNDRMKKEWCEDNRVVMIEIFHSDKITGAFIKTKIKNAIKEKTKNGKPGKK